MIIVSDTSPITNLAAIGRLDLLQTLYERIIIPSEVYNEMVRIGKVVPGMHEVKTLPWIETQEVVDKDRICEIVNTREKIDLGEAAAIALAIERKADVLLMDERRGRAVATEFGLKVVGLLGVLLQANRQNLIPSIKPLMDQLIEQADFRVSAELYKMVLKEAKESNRD